MDPTSKKHLFFLTKRKYAWLWVNLTRCHVTKRARSHNHCFYICFFFFRISLSPLEIFFLRVPTSDSIGKNIFVFSIFYNSVIILIFNKNIEVTVFFLSFYFVFVVIFKGMQRHCCKLHLLNIIIKNIVGMCLMDSPALFRRSIKIRLDTKHHLLGCWLEDLNALYTVVQCFFHNS